MVRIAQGSIPGLKNSYRPFPSEQIANLKLTAKPPAESGRPEVETIPNLNAQPSYFLINQLTFNSRFLIFPLK